MSYGVKSTINVVASLLKGMRGMAFSCNDNIVETMN